MRASRGLKWENKMYKLKRSVGNGSTEVAALIEVSIGLMYNDQSCFLEAMWNFLRHFFSFFDFSKKIVFLGDQPYKVDSERSTLLARRLFNFHQ